MTARERILQIAQRLEKHFGKLHWQSHGDPLDVLILTILSQNTNDQNRDRAYESLKRRFPTYESIVRAPTEKVAEAIKVGGLHQQKAQRIQELLKRIKKERGAYDLSYLKDLSTEEAVKELLKFEGVGKKTAGVVLTFSLNKPYFPVDTHIHRITQRLGLVKKNQDPHDVMNRLVPDGLKYQLHLHLIWHGRQTCKARKPLCDQCVIADLCPYAKALTPGPSPVGELRERGTRRAG
ncbi:MAG: endonuclease III domain-containing protein [Candidatus Bipolaricaulia bacterium]